MQDSPLMQLVGDVGCSPLMQLAVVAHVDGERVELACRACHALHSQPRETPTPWRHDDGCLYVSLELAVREGTIPIDRAKRLLTVALMLRASQVAASLSRQMRAADN